MLSKTFNVGTGDKFDEASGELFEAGGYSYVAKGMTHYAWFTEDTVIQLYRPAPHLTRM